MRIDFWMATMTNFVSFRTVTFLLFSFYFANNTNAGWFGYDTLEECMHKELKNPKLYGTTYNYCLGKIPKSERIKIENEKKRRDLEHEKKCSACS